MVNETVDDPWGEVTTADDDPWAAAANTAAHAKSSFHLSNTDNPPGNTTTTGAAIEDVDPDGCGFNTLYAGLQVWHLLDICLGCCITFYGALISAQSSVETLAVVLVLAVGILVLARGVGGACALWTESTCQRFGLTVSAGTSPILAGIWLVLMGINGIAAGHVQTYIVKHKLLWGPLQKWEASHKGTLTLLLLAAFVLECVRWQLVQRLQRKLESLEAMEDARERELADRRTRLPDRPWWWRRGSNALDPNDPLTDSLLPVSGDPANHNNNSGTVQHPAWSFFGRRQRNNNHLREDASVSFASVQEEWASRAEEDPYWWSRDEGNNNNNNSSSSPPTEEITWTDGNR